MNIRDTIGHSLNCIYSSNTCTGLHMMLQMMFLEKAKDDKYDINWQFGGCTFRFNGTDVLTVGLKNDSSLITWSQRLLQYDRVQVLSKRLCTRALTMYEHIYYNAHLPWDDLFFADLIFSMAYIKSETYGW